MGAISSEAMRRGSRIAELELSRPRAFAGTGSLCAENGMTGVVQWDLFGGGRPANGLPHDLATRGTAWKVRQAE